MYERDRSIVALDESVLKLYGFLGVNSYSQTQCGLLECIPLTMEHWNDATRNDRS